jgi:hypothetical protein
LFFTGVELTLSPKERKEVVGILGQGVEETIWSSAGKQLEAGGENCVMMGFIIRTLHQILLGQ